jgi:hypothetical protein
MEMKMNEYASNVAPEACADFMGHVFVGPQESTRRLRQGLWLVGGWSSYITLLCCCWCC